MKPITEFRQLLLRFKVRDFTQRNGRKPTRVEYYRLQYAADIEKRREAARVSSRRRWARWLISSVCNDNTAQGEKS